MYINFWYPIALSEAITNRLPLRVHIMMLDFVAFRDSDGQAYVLSDTCVHRGGKLSDGRIRGNCIECPYHGWQFDGVGRCTKIPILGDAKYPARAKVDAYPVQERYGIVFAFLGDLPEAERPPLWHAEEFDQDGWRANKVVVLEPECYFERSIENGLDPAHNEFVHPKQGAPAIKQDLSSHPIKTHDMGGWGFWFAVRFHEEKQASALISEGRVGEPGFPVSGSGHIGPNFLTTWIRFSKQNEFRQHLFEAPIDENNTRLFFLNMRHFMTDPDQDSRLMDANLQIIGEDVDVLRGLNPVRTPESLTREILLPADLPIVRYREYLKAFDDRGWKIDLKTLNEKRGETAFAIPSPARQTSGNWVLDSVPLKPGRQ